MKVFVLLIFVFGSAFTQHQIAVDDETICNQKFSFAISDSLHKKNINEVIVEIGKTFLGVPYTANSLEVNKEEALVVNLRALDCVSFYENCLALARCIKQKKYSFEDYKKELQFIRYRNGKIDGYTSRLHYTSDYFYNNQEKGILKILSTEVAEIDLFALVPSPINFMTENRNLYKGLSENLEYAKMLSIEAKISRRQIRFIPKEELPNIVNNILPGDILGFTTNVKGLDVAHTGIAYKDEAGILKLLHAPNVGEKVSVSKKSLVEYLNNNSKFTGIIIARAVNL